MVFRRRRDYKEEAEEELLPARFVLDEEELLLLEPCRGGLGRRGRLRYLMTFAFQVTPGPQEDEKGEKGEEGEKG